MTERMTIWYQTSKRSVLFKWQAGKVSLGSVWQPCRSVPAAAEGQGWQTRTSRLAAAAQPHAAIAMTKPA